MKAGARVQRLLWASTSAKDKTFSPVSRTTNSACEQTEHDSTPQKLKWRHDVVTDGGHADALMANAPGGEEHFFTVPKVVE